MFYQHRTSSTTTNPYIKMPIPKYLQNPTLEKILNRAAEAKLSEKAIDFITRTAEKVLSGLKNADKIGEQELLIMLRTGIYNDDEERSAIFLRTPGSVNWGEEALVFIERY